ncbi:MULTISPECIES: hypothetical protein [Idiomarinaceae]|uniref:Uncharacterized protein n=4 Tax=Pseudidiomarina TaxID=2800384 RepID=A0A368UJY7_9GAMM|nr:MULTISPECIES: hypothetical protein [Idiomarinaceae]MDT7526798.1 hypothetical protein [Pseudidiomarina sp. GXY010]MDX1526199.1 hypothetical protein [Pseudidiomarina maritima]MRJ43175.1 hypothetical protein [Idiomarina sp. FeN1]NCU58690.1 hypothetical protein [Idiomarina sp. FenA--70]NCU61386.1 hypothetical protein [Idiomarina sp. FenBw--71]
MPHGPLLEALLAGQYICAITNEDYFTKLQRDEVREGLDDYLRPLNRRVATNDEQTVFFLAYRDIDEPAREHLKQQLSVVMSSMLPLLEWLTYVQEAMGSDAILTAGDTIKLQELMVKTEDNPSLRQRLQALANDKFFNSNADAVDAQAKQVAKRLVEHGYLLQPHANRLYFTVTGKIDYLLDLVRFIKDEENIPLDESQSQVELL